MLPSEQSTSQHRGCRGLVPKPMQISSEAQEDLLSKMTANIVSLSSKLYTDIVLSTCSIPFLNTFKWRRLRDVDSLISEFNSETLVNNHAQRASLSHAAQKIYLDWNLLYCDSTREEDEVMTQCFEALRTSITHINPRQFSFTELQEAIQAESSEKPSKNDQIDIRIFRELEKYIKIITQ